MTTVGSNFPFQPDTYNGATVEKYNVRQYLTKRNYHSFRRVVQHRSAAFWHKISYKMENLLQKSLQGMDKSRDRARFHRHFGDITSRLKSAHYCYLLNSAHQLMIVGELFVTDECVCFYASRTSVQRHKDILRIIIPYTSLAYVLKAGIFRMQGFPDIVPLSQGVNPKVLLLLTMEGQCFIFGGFGPSYDRIYNTIYDYQARIWRRN